MIAKLAVVGATAISAALTSLASGVLASLGGTTCHNLADSASKLSRMALALVLPVLSKCSWTSPRSWSLPAAVWMRCTETISPLIFSRKSSDAS